MVISEGSITHPREVATYLVELDPIAMDSRLGRVFVRIDGIGGLGWHRACLGCSRLQGRDRQGRGRGKVAGRGTVSWAVVLGAIHGLGFDGARESEEGKTGGGFECHDERVVVGGDRSEEGR